MKHLDIATLTLEEIDAMTLDQWSTLTIDPFDDVIWFVDAKDVWSAGSQAENVFRAGAEQTDVR